MAERQPNAGAEEHEEALIRAFITPAKRSRYLDKLGSPKSRRAFINEHLFHMGDFDERYVEQIDPRMPLAEFDARQQSHIDKIHDLLRDRGAPSQCYVISTRDDLDGRFLNLRDTLDEIDGHFDGTLLSCIPGRLAYYDGENHNDRCILQRSE